MYSKTKSNIRYTQEEVDHYTLISDSVQEMPCGWLKDQFGVTWQVAPEMLLWLMNDPGPKKASAVMQARMKMKKIINKDLEQAYAQA